MATKLHYQRCNAFNNGKQCRKKAGHTGKHWNSKGSWDTKEKKAPPGSVDRTVPFSKVDEELLDEAADKFAGELKKGEDAKAMEALDLESNKAYALTSDPEMATLVSIVKMLNDLDTDARLRVLIYLDDRFGTNG